MSNRSISGSFNDARFGNHTVIQGDNNNQIHGGSTEKIDLTELHTFIGELQKVLPVLGLHEQEQQKAQDNIVAIEKEVQAEKPDVSAIQNALQTVRNVVEGATGSIVATSLQPTIDGFLEYVSTFMI